MKRFTRQKSESAPTVDINLDFGAAAAKVSHLFEPGEYRLRIDSASICQSKQKNTLVVLDLVETDGGGRVAIRPLWVDGPKAGGAQLG